MSTISSSISFIFGNASETRNFSGASTTGDDWVSGRGTATSGSPAALPVGNVGTEGLLFIINTDDDDNVENLLIALDGGTNYDIIILPKHFNFISVGTTGAVYVKSSGGSGISYEYLLTEA